MTATIAKKNKKVILFFKFSRGAYTHAAALLFALKRYQGYFRRG